MLSNNLNTNEVKNAAGTEVEFGSISQVGRQHVFAQTGESPALPHRLSINHQETGSGLRKRRRSVVRIDKTSISSVDSVTPVTATGYIVLDAPIGALTATTELKTVVAELLSFCATTGAATTVLFDCTGNGADVLVNGTL